ncbi:hypothetical protein K4A83_14160 [Spirulina subsalsa FACHB-351]|uniref:Uncharacterized protein n=2 Tax=Spirulina subsalsa TaxID=54311 RepID=A0ABT3L7A9_9CYAN|nr:hypothetical protein [Spirulina subsalsa FACHB-351]
MLPLFPLLLLFLALGNICIYQRSTNELTRVLTVATAAVCLIWGFAIAHWSIHLLSLLLLFKYRGLAFALSSSRS